MILWVLIIIPLAAGIASYLISSNRIRRGLWIFAAFSHFVFSLLLALFNPEHIPQNTWLLFDAVSRIFLPLTSLLFFTATLYAVGSFQNNPHTPQKNSDLRFKPEAIFTGCLMIFLASMTTVILSRRLGLQWVAIEATTLATTPLIYFHQGKRSLEAAWKYILLCSVGIAIALLGIFSLALSAGGITTELSIDALVQHATELDARWLKLVFIFILVGYGTKMGLAPLHTWLPDAHSEAPSAVSALLSGALLNCAYIGILRILQLLNAAHIGDFGAPVLIGFGLFSMGTASIFILRQPDYKRLLAYSSVEHMGIIILGTGLAQHAMFGSLLHAVNHSFVKAMLFMTAGNILTIYATKRIDSVRALKRTAPVVAILWFGGFLAITGSPPFGTFISEFSILQEAIQQERFVTAGLYLFCLLLVFIGMAATFTRMTFGPPAENISSVQLHPWTVIPPVFLGVASLTLGVFIPEQLDMLLRSAAQVITGGALQ
ncbi:MAG: NADH dehydrogenase FAD-containing subunit [Deltaproteobacteria bacterium]|nr:NADH dehydrogenase FAD-containing subunit [Deltaproteobacteria bacterium]MBN2673547.1 NADH dehydrogenase FAD-containing subunit [Deltaproteobacteria bacterium]